MIRVGKVIGKYSQALTIYYDSGYYDQGQWVISSTITASIRGSVQEAVGKNLKYVPEGTRLEDTRVVYSTQRLPIDDLQESNYANVRFQISNVQYRLISKKEWTPLAIVPTNYQNQPQADYYIYTIELLRSSNAVPNL